MVFIHIYIYNLFLRLPNRTKEARPQVTSPVPAFSRNCSTAMSVWRERRSSEGMVGAEEEEEDIFFCACSYCYLGNGDSISINYFAIELSLIYEIDHKKFSNLGFTFHFSPSLFSQRLKDSFHKARSEEFSLLVTGLHPIIQLNKLVELNSILHIIY